MTKYFFDTSALVKIYHQEEGSDFCLGCYRSELPLVISELSKVELYSAVHRKLHEKRLTHTAVDLLLKRFYYDCANRFEVMCITTIVYEEACRLIELYSCGYGLRTLDSIQLASFLVYCDTRAYSFVCADRKLSLVAQAEKVNAILI